jgi:hypothetical protein
MEVEVGKSSRETNVAWKIEKLGKLETRNYRRK